MELFERMKCQQAENWMDLALDAGLAGGEEAAGLGLSPDGRESLDAHLSACPRCRTQWELLRAAEQALRVPQPVTAPSDLLLEFRRRVETTPPPHPSLSARPVRFRWPWLLPIGGLAAVGATAALIVALRAPFAPSAGNPALTVAPPASAPEMAKAQRSREQWEQPLGIRTPAPSGGTTQPAPSAAGAPAPTAPKPAAEGRRFFPQADKGGKQAPQPNQSEARAAKGKDSDAINGVGPSAGAAPATPRGRTETSRMKLYAELQERVAGGAASSAEALRNGTDAPAPERKAVPNDTRFQVAPTVRDEQRVARAEEPTGGPPAPTGLGAGFSGAGAGGFGGGGIRGAMAPVLAQDAQNKPEKRTQPANPSVSTTVLAALRRPVELQTAPSTVQAAALELTMLSDLLVLVDTSVPETNIVPEPKSGPMWEVLQSVARQAKLRVLPRGNQLVLVPDNAPARTTAQTREGYRNRVQLQRSQSQYQEEEATPLSSLLPKVTSKRATGPAGPVAAPALRDAQADRARNLRFGMLDAEGARQPDARVWRPSEWGTLPARGFLPAPLSGEASDTGQRPGQQAPAGAASRRRSPATSPRPRQRPR